MHCALVSALSCHILFIKHVVSGLLLLKKYPPVKYAGTSDEQRENQILVNKLNRDVLVIVIGNCENRRTQGKWRSGML